jgi:hypothetical protein
LFVIEHNRCATVRAGAQLQRPIWVFGVERLTIQSIEVVYFQISVVKEDDMSGILPGNAFTDRAVASVVVYRVVIRMGVNMVAPSNIFI